MTNKKKDKRSIIKYIAFFWVAILVIFSSSFLLIWAVGKGYLGELPSFEELENPKSFVASEVYSSDDILLGKYYKENRSNAKFSELSPNIIKALIATEDIRYEDHSGIDIRGLIRVAIKTIILRQETGGGSTITQQLAKNLFPRKKFKSIPEKVITKIKEWYTAIKLERNYTKNEIITMYLNTVEFGSNSFGIKAASRVFFNTSTNKLSMEESALLIGLLKGTTIFSPVRHPERALKRRNIVLSQIHKYGYLNKAEFDSLQALPIKLDYKEEDHNAGLAPYFREVLREHLHKWSKQAYKPDGTTYDIYRDGLKVYTTIDSRMQHYAEVSVTEHLKPLQEIFFKHWKGKVPWGKNNKVIEDAMKRSNRYLELKKEGVSEDSIRKNFKTPTKMTIFTWKGEIDTIMSPFDSIKYYQYFLQTGFMSIEPHTGYIRAWVGGINHKFFKYDHVKTGRRQVGSTFKPFVYTVAVDNGYSPCYKVPNVPVTIIDGLGRPWIPENSDTLFDNKIITLKSALANSINRVTAYLIKQFGPQSVIEVARRMGITSPIDSVPAICLGTPDISVYELVGAYSTFANKGVWNEPIFVTRIEDKNGNIIEEFTPRQIDALSEETAYVMLNLLKYVVERGTGMRVRFRYKLLNPIAGKTGTTQNHSDGWFIGITPELITGLWVGNEDRSVHFRSLEYGQGASLALPIFGLYMQKVYADSTINLSQGDFDKPMKEINIEVDCSKYDKLHQNYTDFGSEFD